MKTALKWIGIGLAALIVLAAILPSEETDTSPDVSDAYSLSTTANNATTTTSTTATTTTTTATTTTTTTHKSTTTTTTVTATPSTAAQNTPVGEMVWVSETGKKYHSKSSCSGMKSPSQITLEQAKSRGLTPCQKCY